MCSTLNLVPQYGSFLLNPLNAELNHICHLLALLGAHRILHVSRIRVNYIVGVVNVSTPTFIIIIIIIIIIYLFTEIGLLPGGSGYFTCKQNMKLVTTRFKSGGLREKHVVATWNVGSHLSICF